MFTPPYKIRVPHKIKTLHKIALRQVPWERESLTINHPDKIIQIEIIL